MLYRRQLYSTPRIQELDAAEFRNGMNIELPPYLPIFVRRLCCTHTYQETQTNRFGILAG